METTLEKKKELSPSFDEFLTSARKRSPHRSRHEIIIMLKNNIVDYEQKYQMNSKDFISRFEKGEFEKSDIYPDHELFRWWSDYHTYIKLTIKGKH